MNTVQYLGFNGHGKSRLCLLFGPTKHGKQTLANGGIEGNCSFITIQTLNNRQMRDIRVLALLYDILWHKVN